MEPTVTWTTPPAAAMLVGHDLHVWQVPLDVSSDCLDRLLSTLSGEEVVRANRYAFLRDRQHFIVGRATLRLLLSRYLQSPPVSLQIEKGHREKPYLVQNFRASPLRFNLAHSNGLALFAFALHRELGIDLERVRPDFATQEIAQRYFSKSELAELNALPPACYSEGLFSCWTRKEAYVKARGRGMEIPLDSFSVTVSPNHPAELTSDDFSQWSLYSFRPSRQFVAAIAAERSEWRLTFYDASCLL